MTRTDILDKLQTIFRDFFENSEVELNEEFKQEQLEDWDSVAHIQIVLEIENEFDVIFEVEDIPKLVQIGIIIDKIQEQVK